MGLAVEPKDVVEVKQSGELTKQVAVCPSPPLLHQQLNGGRSVGVGWGINYEVCFVSGTWLVVDVVGEQPVFNQVLVGLPASWLLLCVDQLEELLERLASEGLVSVHRVTTGQSLHEATPPLESLEVGVRLLVFVVLHHGDVPRSPVAVRYLASRINYDLRTASTALRICFQVLVELGHCVVAGPAAYIELLDVLRLQVRGKTLEQPLVAVNLAIIRVLEGEQKVDLSASEVLVVADAKVAESGSEQMQKVVRVTLETRFHNVFNREHRGSS